MRKIFLIFLALLLLPLCSAMTSGEATITFGAIFAMGMVVVFFLFLSIMIPNAPLKIFFISLAFLSLLASVGTGVSVTQEFFSDFTAITASFGSFYLLMLILTSAGTMALIVWLIVVAFKSFYTHRGLIGD